MRSVVVSLLLVPVVLSYDADVIIVGAGTSGLVAAKVLMESQPNLKIHVLEQRDRVGGRTINLGVPGYPGEIMEGGGTWLGPTQDHALNLTKELGLELYHTYYNYPGANPETKTPQLWPRPSAEFLKVIDEVERLAKEVGTESPWTYAKAAEYDAMSLKDWLKQQGASKGVMDEMLRAVAPIAVDDLDDISFLFYLFFSASCPFRYDSGNLGGAQDFRLVKGSQAISLELRKRVEDAGVKLQFNSTVKHVAIGGDGVTLTMDQGSLRAKHAIIALGTGDAARLQYTGLTQKREYLHAHWVQNFVMKFFFVFEKAFWREAGIFGKPTLGSGLFFDYTPFNKTSPGIIAGFWDDSDRDGGPVVRRAEIEALLVAALGPRVLGRVQSYVEKHWDLQHEKGTANVVQIMPKGLLTAAGEAWRAPIGRLHWAGSDTAQSWMGYISGAVESGKRTAQEVLADLSDEMLFA